MGGSCKKGKKGEIDFDDKIECNPEAPKNKHGVEFNLSVNSEDADAVRKALISVGHSEIADKLEIKRELSIMHEVWNSEGNDIFQKIDNCLETWRKDDYGKCIRDIREPKYKMKHKVFHATKAK